MASMGKPASQREKEYKAQVVYYLRALETALGWSQSEIARQSGVRSTTINKALKQTHALGYPKLLLLEKQSGIPLQDALVIAARSLNEPTTPASAKDVEAFLQSSPAWQRMVELGRQLAAETDPKTKKEIKRKIEEIAAKVA